MYTHNYELWGVAGCNPWKSIGCCFVKCKNGMYNCQYMHSFVFPKIAGRRGGAILYSINY